MKSCCAAGQCWAGYWYTSLLYVEEEVIFSVWGGQQERKPIWGHMVFLFLRSNTDIIWSDTRWGDFLRLINHSYVNRRSLCPVPSTITTLHYIPPSLVSFPAPASTSNAVSQLPAHLTATFDPPGSATMSCCSPAVWLGGGTGMKPDKRGSGLKHNRHI